MLLVLFGEKWQHKYVAGVQYVVKVHFTDHREPELWRLGREQRSTLREPGGREYRARSVGQGSQKATHLGSVLI